MKKTGKKRQILAMSLILALAAAVTVNWYYTKSTPLSDGAADAQSETRMLGDTVLVAGTNVAPTENADETAAPDANAAAFAELQLKQTQENEALGRRSARRCYADARRAAAAKQGANELRNAHPRQNRRTGDRAAGGRHGAGDCGTRKAERAKHAANYGDHGAKRRRSGGKFDNSRSKFLNNGCYYAKIVVYYHRICMFIR